MKHFIVEITYKVPFEEIQKVSPAHRLYLDEGYAKGMLLMSGPQNPKTGGVVVARANDEKEIKDFFAKDPYHTENVAEHRFVEFTPVKQQDFIKSWIENN
jgi:uncharacterized protein YciI